MQSFADLMFTQAVQAVQTKEGSRAGYARLAERAPTNEIGPDEQAFIESRKTAYLATVSETGWPYVQHRGGPAGFLKVLGPDQLGFAEYRGNRQFVSQGNLLGHGRVAMILMDYPRQARLKILAEAETTDDPAIVAQFLAPDRAAPKRAMLLRVQAFDWNCPKYITPRFDTDEMAALVGPEIDRLRARVAELERQLSDQSPT